MKHYCCPKCGNSKGIALRLSHNPVTAILVQDNEGNAAARELEGDYTLSDMAACPECSEAQPLRVFDTFAEHLLSEAELEVRYAAHVEHPCYTAAWWHRETAANTRLSYWGWVRQQLKRKEDELNGYYVRRDLVSNRVVEFGHLVPGHETTGDLIWCADAVPGRAPHWADDITTMIPAWQSFVLSWRP